MRDTGGGRRLARISHYRGQYQNALPVQLPGPVMAPAPIPKTNTIPGTHSDAMG